MLNSPVFRSAPARLGIRFGLLALAVLVLALPARAQFATKWVAGGSFHNWYAASGSEREEGLVRQQQYGWRWPGIYSFTDMQAAKALWIGASNVTDEFGTNFPFRVIHVGPRVSGVGEVFPTRFDLVTRFPITAVTVDGDISFPAAEMIVDEVNPDIEADVLLFSEFNTLLGVSVQRRVMQFSQEYHDNYHVIEYIFTNTGNTDDDAEIELPNQTVQGFYAYMQNRMAVAAETRYVIGNSTGWGKNTMNDTRGDGFMVDPPDENFRAQFSWHGNDPSFTAYDNIGGPIMPPALPAINIATADTLGRFGASAFAGTVTLHADAGPNNPADDPGQPSTTNWLGSDDPYQSNNDPFSVGQMTTEYSVMSQGHEYPRHAWAVEPTGEPGWLDPNGDPSLGTPGGFSYGNGYGPYTLAPGESVRIVIAEGASGLSREANTVLGRAFKAAGYDEGAPLTYDGQTMTKNEWVFTSRDSLFQTFRRALANQAAGFNIPRPPDPPTSFNVRSGGDRITLEWDVANGDGITGFEIYRAQADYDSTYTLIASPSAADRAYDDLSPVRGVDYYYYIQAVGSASDNTGAGNTPTGVPLKSSRYYTQAYLPARLQRQQGMALDEIRVVPNPYYIGADGRGSTDPVRFADQTDKLAFYNIPGFCRIDIYTELGELVDTVVHEDGSGDDFWDHTTSARQVVASGLYIAVITVTQDVVDNNTGAVIFQQGERAIRKFVIVR